MKTIGRLSGLALLGLLAVGCGGPAPEMEPDPTDLELPDRQVSDVIRKAAYESAMIRGDQAVREQAHARAADAFRDALAQRPDDKLATTRLQEAEFLALMDRGRDDFEKQDYAEALKSLGEAARRRPDHPACLELLAQASAKRRPQLIEQGKAAQAAGQFANAAKAFRQAKDMKADDEVSTLLAEADFLAKWQAARQRVEARQWTAAVEGLEDVLRLKPDDIEARELLKRAKEEKALQLMAEFDRVIASGDSAMQRKDYRMASNFYRQAMAKNPSDTRGRLKLNQAETALRTRESFDRHMSAGKAMMNAKNFAIARVEFQAALADMPGNPEAMRMFQQATQAKR